MSDSVQSVLIGSGLTALASIVVGVAALLRVRSGNRNTDAMTAETIVRASGDVIERLEAEIARMAAEVSHLRLEVSALDGHVDELENLMRRAGITPPPRPSWPRLDIKRDKP